MKTIELTALCVREYDVKYTIVLDENDPLIKEILISNDITFDQLATLDYADYREMWDLFMTYTETDVRIEEDFGMADERFIDFDTFITENE